MLSYLGLVASGAMTLVATNLDNLAILIALLLTTGKRAAVGGFLGAQVLVLLVAALIAEGAEATLTGWTGYLGGIPLVMGVWGLWAQRRADQNEAALRPMRGTLLACFVMFLSLSVDSFAALAPLLADTRPALRLWLMLGAALAVAGVALLGLRFSAEARKGGGWLARLERLGPYAMIIVGLYVLANTGTDTV